MPTNRTPAKRSTKKWLTRAMLTSREQHSLFFTDGHELPVLNTYISGEQCTPGKIPLRSVEDLNEGDYLMFRESSDSDIIRFLAEDELGKAAYQQLRLTAGRWRAALHKLETTETGWISPGSWILAASADGEGLVGQPKQDLPARHGRCP